MADIDGSDPDLARFDENPAEQEGGEEEDMDNDVTDSHDLATTQDFDGGPLEIEVEDTVTDMNGEEEEGVSETPYKIPEGLLEMVPEGMLQSETMQKIVQMQLDIIREDYERVEEFESTYTEQVVETTMGTTTDAGRLGTGTSSEEVLGAAAKKFGAKAEPAKKDEKPLGAAKSPGIKKAPAGAKPGEEFHFETSKEALTEAERQKKKQKELEEMLKKALEEARLAEEEARRLAELEARRKREEEERKRREEEERKRREEEERRKREEAERKRKEEEERKRREAEEKKRREEEERRRKEEEERKRREEEERKRREEEERKRREEEEARRKKEEEEARRRREEEMKKKAEEEAKRKSQLADPSQRWQRLRDEKLGVDSSTDPRLQRVRMREEAADESRRRTRSEDEAVVHATEQARRAAKLAARKTARERRARMPGRQPLVRSITNVPANEKVAREYLNYLLEDLNRRAPHQRIRAGAAMYEKDESRQYIPPALKSKDEFKRLNAKCKNEDSVDILLDDAIVDDVERKHRSSVIDRVLDFLKTHMPVPATEIILGGSIGQGTAAPSYAAVQIVVLSDDFPKGGHEMWLPSAVVAYRKILEKAALEEGQLPDLTFVGHSQTTLQFMVEDVDVDMYFTHEWGDTEHDYDHLYREAMMIRETKARNCYAISAVRRQNAWVAGLPEVVKDVVRMVKNWRNCVDWGEKKKRPNSYLLTLMVHKAYEEACRFTEDVNEAPMEEDILKEFINLSQKLDRAIGRVTWNDYYDPELYRVEHISRLPVVQDPAMPAFNVGETMESWNMMRHEAWIWGQSLGILKL
ncbi:PREDICTED: trichohyalin-like isoform X4 [Branchiostoma belcheri]|uniref:Trichohyalin-like isoform X4 n=1 Tax=Branchiostoma belcheri TaxID=7741 RepID=A0A6P4ZH20_BRABE|nr:PREDICTED: trichohyalin-like isoform X4 [Branchiostoma belcheri]